MNPFKKPDELKVSDSVKRLNPHLFGLGRVESPQRQPSERRQSEDRRLESVPQRVGIRVVIVSFRKRLCDAHDNLRTGAKPLVDCIANSLGIDDGDPRVTWEYHQVRSVIEGTTVTIQVR